MTESVVRWPFASSALAVSLLVLAACGSSDMTGPLPVSSEISLGAGQYSVLSGSAISGAVRFPAAGSSGAEYLVVGQLASGTADLSTSFLLGGQASATASVAASPLAHEATLAEQFHGNLRALEAAMAARAARAAVRPLPRVMAPPPVVGQSRTFKVCANINCSSTKNVSATAQVVGQHLAVFVDDSAPANGFTLTDLQSLATQFDTHLYPIDVDRFGAESDIDGNGIVLVLLTKQINALVPKPQCSTSFITGFFFGGDIDPVLRTTYNSAEIFYGMVPDPTGQVSCAYSVTAVRNLLPVTFIHEFQHMISYNQHVLVRGGAAEVLWLNEGMSHLAEELGALHYDSLGDAAWKSRFLLGDLYNAYSFLRAPNGHALLTENPPGTLEERGAGWLFVRYLVDQFGSTTTRSLEQTSQVGVLNAQAAAGGTPIERLLSRWALAIFLTDLPSFSPPPELTYAYWRFRTTFASLHQQSPQDFPLAYPLLPDSSFGAGVRLTGTLTSGSGAYVLPRQDAGAAAFDLIFRSGGGGSLPSNGGSQLSIMRIR